MHEFVQSVQSPIKLELLDQSTYLLLQRLAEAGIITINSESAESLYRSPAFNRIVQTEKERLLAEAKKIFREAEHKAKLMNLLLSGDFFIESLAPLKEAVACVLKCYLVMKKGNTKEGELLLEKIEVFDDQSDETEIKFFVESANLLIQNCAESLAKFALV